MTIGLLLSGELGYKLLKKIHIDYDIIFISTDSKSKKIISYAKNYNINFFVGNPRNKKLVNYLNFIKCDILASINYLFLIDKEIIDISRKIAFNIHGSLLPKYRGRTPHVWAIINGENKCGITSHVIDEGCDTGDIIFQKEVKINIHDTGYSILKKYEKLYYPIFKKTINLISKKNKSFIKQNNSLSSYFGKRTEDSGLIDWSWKSKYMYNWVRAQSNPYPGAFSIIKKKKLIIDCVEITKIKFDVNISNGTIISVNNNSILIKVSDGILKITKIRNFKFNQFKSNQILK